MAKESGGKVPVQKAPLYECAESHESRDGERQGRTWVEREGEKVAGRGMGKTAMGREEGAAREEKQGDLLPEWTPVVAEGHSWLLMLF